MTMGEEAILIPREAKDTVIPSGDRLLLLPFHRFISLWRPARTTPIWTSWDTEPCTSKAKGSSHHGPLILLPMPSVRRSDQQALERDLHFMRSSLSWWR